MSNYLTYCRKSTESEERQVLSVESQKKELKTLAGRLNLPISEILTEAKSAKYPGRPVFNQMMKRVYRGEIKGIITWKLDRLARNPIDGSALVWALDQGKISEIVTPHQSFSNNSNDKFLMQLEFGMAKKYVDDLSDNVKRGLKAKCEKGWFPGLPPLGYLNEPKERTIVKDPERFQLVRKLWDLLFQGMSVSQIQRIASEKLGLRTRAFKRYGGGPLSQSGIYRIFQNPFYYGLIERKEGTFMGKHDPMITDVEYWNAQRILGRNGRPRPKTHHFPFTGLIRCGECGCMITAEERDNRYGTHYVYYRCTKKRGACRQRYLNVKDLEAQVIDYFKRIYIPEPLLAIGIKHLEKDTSNETIKLQRIEESLKKALKECERKLHNLTDMRLKDLIDDEEYRAEKKRLIQEKIRLKDSLKHEGERMDAIDLTKRALVFASHARDNFQNGTPEQKRALLQEVGSNFVLKDRKLTIYAEKPFLILGEGLKDIGRGKWPVEPTANGSTERKIGLSDAQIRTWCPR